MAETKLNINQIGQPPEVFNSDNLIAGKNIAIQRHVNPNVITDDTIEVWHFDEEPTNSTYTGVVNSLPMRFVSDGAFSSTNYKFGTGSSKGMRQQYANGGYKSGADISSFNITTNNELTIDFWILFSTLGQSTGAIRNHCAYFDNNVGIDVYWDYDNNTVQVKDMNSEQTSAAIPVTTGWHHIAYTYDGSYAEGKTKSICYIDGINTLEQIIDREFTPTITRFYLTYSQVYYVSAPTLLFDEVRISKGIVYTENFADNLPTEEYAEDSDDKIYEIVNTQDISGKQDTLVSGTNIKTINNNSILGSGNLTISLPENVYTTDNLIAGNSISITQDSSIITATSSSGAYAYTTVTPSDIHTANTWEFKTVLDFVAGGVQWILGNSTGYGVGPQFIIYDGNKLSTYLSSDGSNFDIASNPAPTFELTDGSRYELSLGYDSTVGYTVTAEDLTTHVTNTWLVTDPNGNVSTAHVYCDSPLYFMNNTADTSCYLHGTMYFSSTTLTIGDVVWFDGATAIQNTDYTNNGLVITTVSQGGNSLINVTNIDGGDANA